MLYLEGNTREAKFGDFITSGGSRISPLDRANCRMAGSHLRTAERLRQRKFAVKRHSASLRGLNPGTWKCLTLTMPIWAMTVTAISLFGRYEGRHLPAAKQSERASCEVFQGQIKQWETLSQSLQWLSLCVAHVLEECLVHDSQRGGLWPLAPRLKYTRSAALPSASSTADTTATISLCENSTSLTTELA